MPSSRNANAFRTEFVVALQWDLQEPHCTKQPHTKMPAVHGVRAVTLSQLVILEVWVNSATLGSQLVRSPFCQSRPSNLSMMTTPAILHLDFADGAFNEYRMREDKVEFRSGEGAWLTLQTADLRLHFLLHTPVADWLRKQSANAEIARRKWLISSPGATSESLDSSERISLSDC